MAEQMEYDRERYIPDCDDMDLQAVQVDGREAFVETSWGGTGLASTLYIEGNDYIYLVFCSGAFGEEPTDWEERQSQRSLRLLIDSWRFFGADKPDMIQQN